MPKDKSSCSFSKSRSHGFFSKPYSRGSTKKPGALAAKQEEPAEWEHVSCPICMDSPHNAVLLLCSSHGKGCRPYMCDTSYRHSNCLDQYITQSKPDSGAAPAVAAASQVVEDGKPEAGTGTGGRVVRARKGLNLVCPLCRGRVTGWEVVEAARRRLNLKSRSCSHDSCGFSGAYEELRKHARCVHPTARPSQIDPIREMNWRRLESERERGDILSTMPNATVVGDYVIEDDGDDEAGFEDDEESDSEMAGQHQQHQPQEQQQQQQQRHRPQHLDSWTMLVLFRLMEPRSGVAEARNPVSSTPAFFGGGGAVSSGRGSSSTSSSRASALYPGSSASAASRSRSRHHESGAIYRSSGGPSYEHRRGYRRGSHRR